MTVAVPPFRSIANACSAVCLQPDRLEGVVHAAAGELVHLLDGIARRRVDEVGGTELLGELRASRHPVDRDDAARARQSPRLASR